MNAKIRRIEERLAKVTRARRPGRRYVFRFGEEEQARAQGLPYVLMPKRVTTTQEWQEWIARSPRTRCT
jgi:hypothetical protein